MLKKKFKSGKIRYSYNVLFNAPWHVYTHCILFQNATDSPSEVSRGKDWMCMSHSMDVCVCVVHVCVAAEEHISVDPFLLTGGETGEWIWKDRLGSGGFGEVS